MEEIWLTREIAPTLTQHDSIAYDTGWFFCALLGVILAALSSTLARTCSS